MDEVDVRWVVDQQQESKQLLLHTLVQIAKIELQVLQNEIMRGFDLQAKQDSLPDAAANASADADTESEARQQQQHDENLSGLCTCYILLERMVQLIAEEAELLETSSSGALGCDTCDDVKMGTIDGHSLS